MSDSWVVQNLNNALNTWNEKTGRSVGTSADGALEFQGRRHMEGDTPDQRSSTGNRACTARFVFSGRSCSDLGKPYGCQKAGARAEAVSALCNCQGSSDIRT